MLLLLAMLDFNTLTTLRVTIEGHVADVAFDRPNELNAMNTAFFREAKICMEALDRHPGAYWCNPAHLSG